MVAAELPKTVGMSGLLAVKVMVEGKALGVPKMEVAAMPEAQNAPHTVTNKIKIASVRFICLSRPFQPKFYVDDMVKVSVA